MIKYSDKKETMGFKINSKTFDLWDIRLTIFRF